MTRWQQEALDIKTMPLPLEPLTSDGLLLP